MSALTPPPPSSSEPGFSINPTQSTQQPSSQPVSYRPLPRPSKLPDLENPYRKLKVTISDAGESPHLAAKELKDTPRTNRRDLERDALSARSLKKILADAPDVMEKVQAFVTNLSDEEIKSLIKQINSIYSSELYLEDIFIGGLDEIFIGANSRGDSMLVRLLCAVNPLMAMRSLNIDLIGSYTPLMDAVKNGNVEVVRALVELPEAMRRIGNDFIGSAAESNVSIFQKTSTGHTVLMSAAIAGNLEVVKFLLQKGAPLADRNKEGMTALMLAEKSGQMEVVKLLREAMSGF